VTLEAVPAPGYRFDNWSGGISSSERLIIIKAGKDRTVTANFSRIIPIWLVAIIATAAIPLVIFIRRRKLAQTSPET
jgi:hypothetical protein